MKVQTVLGDISPQELGKTACHEHLIWRVPDPPGSDDPDLGYDSVTAALAEVERFARAGGGALVEMTTSDIGRSPLDLKLISQKTGVHIIAAAGHHKHKFSAAYLVGKSVGEIEAEIVTELTQGIGETGVKAGVIKAATSLHAATESERRVIEAVGKAHQATGAPVSTHTEAGTFALKQIDLLTNAGVAPERVLIGHLDQNLPREVYFEAVARGVNLGFDQIGKAKYWPDEQRAKMIKELIDAGFASQLMLSGDRARKSSWNIYNPQVEGIAHVLSGFSELLRDAGLTEEDLHALMVENPARFFAF
jgi:phosphotriesterase-related protein